MEREDVLDIIYERLVDWDMDNEDEMDTALKLIQDLEEIGIRFDE